MTTGLEFEPLSHSYAWDGKVVPSVTAIMSPLVSYYRVPSERLRLAAERGTAVHALTEAWDKAEYQDHFDTFHMEHGGFLQAWIRFREDYDFTPTHIEERVYHPLHEYAGTADRFGVVKGHLAVVDIKTTDRLGPAVGVQLAAYQHAANCDRLPRAQLEHRYAVQLCEDGTYKVKQYKSAHDWSAFLGCLALWHWQRETHGSQKGEIRLLPLAPDSNLVHASNDPRPLYG